MALDDDDEWEVDVAGKIPQHDTAERYERLTSSVADHHTERVADQEEINSGGLLLVVWASVLLPWPVRVLGTRL